jgi:5-formaminoimidazole-4-carboxamide-1-beta-D-ribofuranosyl 5'-monophosphate synthetase
MTVSYEQARESARARFEPGWTVGTFCLDDRYIIENDEFYIFDIGAREYLIDDNMEYAIIGSVTIVYKEDGKISALSSCLVPTDPTIRSKPNPNPTVVI